jgi:hypothetical protein
MEQIIAVWNFVGEHFWTIVTLAVVIRYRKSIYNDLFFTPLAGGNGKVQMDEAAKAVIIAVLLWCVARDGYRTHEWPYFSGTFYATLLAGLFSIAAIKPVVAILNSYKNGKNEPNIPEDDGGDSSVPSRNVDSKPVD